MSQDDFFADLGIQRHDETGDSGKPKGRRARSQEKKERRRRKRRRRWLTSVVLVIVLAVAGVVAYRAVDFMQTGNLPAAEDYEGPGGEDVSVTVPDGATVRDIGQMLEELDVVASSAAFVQAYESNSKANSIQAGTYTLKKHMSAANAVAALLDPASRANHSLTVAEGMTKYAVRDRLVEVGGFEAAEVDKAFADTEAIGLPAEAGGEVEGWLAPSTYDVSKDTTATEVVAQMVSTQKSRLAAAGVNQQAFKDVLTKASIVEREVNFPEYYGKVARVIDNRLADTEGETQGKLQMDSTVLYGLQRSGGMPSSEELADASNSYNTYQHAGLPPTPIGSPGEETIKAVINPPEGDWLYFVTVNLQTGETLFARTHEEQQANTEKLNAYCKTHEKDCEGEPGSSAAPSGSAAPPADSSASAQPDQ